LVFKIIVVARKDLFKIGGQFAHASSEKFASPGLVEGRRW